MTLPTRTEIFFAFFRYLISINSIYITIKRSLQLTVHFVPVLKALQSGKCFVRSPNLRRWDFRSTFSRNSKFYFYRKSDLSEKAPLPISFIRLVYLKESFFDYVLLCSWRISSMRVYRWTFQGFWSLFGSCLNIHWSMKSATMIQQFSWMIRRGKWTLRLVLRSKSDFCNENEKILVNWIFNFNLF